MLKCKAILNHVVFIFKDEVHQGQFAEEKIGSIILANKGKDFKSDANLSRLATVHSVGPECKLVKVGDTIIVEKQCWTPGFIIQDDQDNNVEVWRTDERYVVAIVD